MRRTPRATTWLAALVGALLAFAGVAQAAVHTGVLTDPVDMGVSINGGPTSNDDIEQLSAVYDDARGGVSLTVRLYLPLPEYTSSWVSMRLASGDCTYTATGAAGIGISARLDGSYQSATIAGYTDAPPLTRMLSPDRRELTLSMAHPVLAGRAYDCFSANTWYASDTYRYDPSCNCVTRIYTLDRMDAGRFPGYQPPVSTLPTPPPSAMPTRDPRCSRWSSLARATNAKIRVAQRARLGAKSLRARKAAGKRVSALVGTRLRYQRAMRTHC